MLAYMLPFIYRYDPLYSIGYHKVEIWGKTRA